MKHVIDDSTTPRQMTVAAVEFLGVSFLGGGDCALVFRAENGEEDGLSLAAVMLHFDALFSMMEAVTDAMDRLAEEVVTERATK